MSRRGTTTSRRRGKDVIIVGGGDTGADCLRNRVAPGGKRSVTQFQIHPEPQKDMPELNPWWPQPAMILKQSAAHEEGGSAGVGHPHDAPEPARNGHVRQLHAVRVQQAARDAEGRRAIVPVPGSELIFAADLVSIAIGYSGPDPAGLLTDLGVALDDRGNVHTHSGYETSVPGVFAAGDCRRGQSLIVWAIAEGREAAHDVDKYLMGTSRLPLTAYK